MHRRQLEPVFRSHVLHTWQSSNLREQAAWTASPENARPLHHSLHIDPERFEFQHGSTDRFKIVHRYDEAGRSVSFFRMLCRGFGHDESDNA